MSRLARTVLMYLKLSFGFAGLGVICLAWTPFALLFNVVLPRAPRQRLGRLAVAIGFRAYLRYLALIGVAHCDLSELDRLRDQGPMILAPNHPSLLDAVMVLSRLQNLTCIIKASLFDSVFFGAGARMAGYIRNDTLIGVVKNASVALNSGSQLLMFPEGTRTTEPPLNPLKGGLALTATRAGMPVQVLIIETDANFLGKGWSFFGGTDFPVRYRIRLGARFDPPREATSFLPRLEAEMRAELARGADQRAVNNCSASASSRVPPEFPT
jgi:1-acyl-sn-glycerol-3-phosphate acyltransferase